MTPDPAPTATPDGERPAAVFAGYFLRVGGEQTAGGPVVPDGDALAVDELAAWLYRRLGSDSRRWDELPEDRGLGSLRSCRAYWRSAARDLRTDAFGAASPGGERPPDSWPPSSWAPYVVLKTFTRWVASLRHSTVSVATLVERAQAALDYGPTDDTTTPAAETATLALCDLIHDAVTSTGHDCPEDDAAVFCYDVAAALLAAGVVPPGGAGTTPPDEAVTEWGYEWTRGDGRTYVRTSMDEEDARETAGMWPGRATVVRREIRTGPWVRAGGTAVPDPGEADRGHG